LSNETETPSLQSDHSSAANTGGATEGQPHNASGGGNGYDSVASQYRAMQEAQLLHEETINQLREEIRGQRERIAELARSTPGQKSTQLDMVMLRLTELERKIGEGAPDPLLNEIVHRLAALENSGPMRGMKDPRVDDIYVQIEALRKQAPEPAGHDPRTDDVVLRIASLEAAFRRAAQSRDPEEVQARIDTLANELNARQTSEIEDLRGQFAELAKVSEAASERSGDAASSAELQSLAERFAAIEKQLSESIADARLTEFGNQLAALDRKLSEQTDEELESRVQALEERLQQDNTPSVLELVADRISGLEEKLEAAPAGATLEQLMALEERLEQAGNPEQLQQLREQVDALSSHSEDSDLGRRLLELSGRLRGLEVRLDATPFSEKSVQDLRDRLSQLSDAISAKPSPEALTQLEAELQALKADAAQASPGLPAGLDSRLAELESRISETESSSRLEDADARLAALEAKLNALGNPAEVSRRLTVLEMDSSPADPRLEDVLHRLSVMEAKPFESLSDSRLHELSQSVADLHAELETISNDRLPVVTELPERLTRLEARLTEATRSAAGGADQQEFLAEFRDQVRLLAERVDELAARPMSAQDPRVSELLARIEWIEKNPAQGDALPDGASSESILRRIEVLEQSIAAGAHAGVSSGMQAEVSVRLQALEHAVSQVEVNAGDGAGAGAGAASVEAALKKETDRWNQWARTTIDEISELRERVEDAGGGTGGGLDAESVEALAVQISSGLNNSEVHALRGQMYFVYLSIGVLWALVLYVLFAG
jgi:hypothetical protein